MKLFISYAHRDGFGNIVTNPNVGDLNNIEDIRYIQNEIEKTFNVNEVIILNIVKLPIK